MAGAITIASLCLATTPAAGGQSDFTMYECRDEWETSVGAITTIDFTELPYDTYVDDQYADLGVHFPAAGDMVFEAFFDDGAGLRNEFGSEVIVDFTEPQKWVGFDLPSFGLVLQYRLYSDGEIVFETPFATSEEFAGFVSGESFDLLIVTALANSEPFVDNLHFGPGCADTNGDLVINADDLVNVIVFWGTDGVGESPPGTPVAADVAGALTAAPDGVVNVNDLIAVINQWGVCGAGGQ